MIRNGNDLAIISIGHIGNEVVNASEKLEAEGISVAHYDIRFLKPIDEDLLHEVLIRFGKVITVEDGTVTGGLGSAVSEFITDHQYNTQLVRLGIPDRFVEQGSIGELQKECGYDAKGIEQRAMNLIKSR